MSVLQDFDAVFLFSSQFFRDFITGVEQKFKEVVESALEMTGELPPPLDQPEEVLEETLANFFLPVPRLLFATKNPQYPQTFPCPPGSDGLLERLEAHRDLGTFDDGIGQPNRLTFLRPDFFNFENNPVKMKFESGRVRITLEGKVSLGRRFNRSNAETSTDTFSMDLLYQPAPLPIARIAQNLVGLVSYISNGTANPPLPLKGFPVYVKSLCLETDAQGNCKKFKHILPTKDDFPVETCDQKEQAQGQERASRVQLFRGQVGDQIFESETATTPRFEVRFQLTEDMQLAPVLVDLQNDDQIVANGVGGRIVMHLIGIENLTIRISGQTNPFSSEGMKAICRSLVKVNPFSPLVQGTPPPEILRLLDLFGGLDFLFFIQTLQLSFNPRIKEGETFVRSDSNRVQLTKTKVFPDPNGLVALAGDLVGSPSPGNITALSDFSKGLDLTFGLSQEFLDAVLLQPLNRSIKKALECKKKIKDGSVTVTAQFKNPSATHPRGFIQVEARGSGTIPNAILWIDVDFDFTARFPIGLDLQNAIMRKKFWLDDNGQEVPPEDPTGTPVELPVNAYGGRIPLEALTILGIGPPEFTTTDPHQNPICFLGYCDPRKLTPSPLYCTVPATPPPVVDASGNQVPPPPGVEPDPSCRSQVNFVDHPELVHAKEITFPFPSKDEIDMDVDVDLGFVDYIVLLVVGVITTLIGCLFGPIGCGVGAVLGFSLLATAIIADVNIQFLAGLLGFPSPKEQFVSKAASTRVPSVDLTLDLQVDLVSYAADAEIQEGAFIVRNRTIVEPQSEMSGFEGIGL